MASPFADPAPTPATILRHLGRSPSKALGQHFLHDQNVVRRIASLAAVGDQDTVVEVGPGLGILTAELARRARRVIAIEKDLELATWLAEVAPANVEIVNADALQLDPDQLPTPPYKVVANLPYNVGNAIIRRFLEAERSPTAMTVMVQREVASRIIAEPPNMSILAVAVRFFGDPRFGFRVGRGAFIPPPNVDSSVIRIELHEPALPRAEWQSFFDLMRGGFGQRRKQLVNTLAESAGVSKDKIRANLTKIGLSPQARPEELSLEQWVDLYSNLRSGSHLGT